MSVVESPTKGKWYDLASRKISDPRFVFMNHGYAAVDGPDEFDWLEPGDIHQKYGFNFVRHLVRQVELDGKRVVDVGCGRGGSCSYFLRYASPESVTGVDLSHGNIEYCRKTHEYPDAEFLQGNAQDLPVESATVDLVFNLESSHLYEEPVKFLQEVVRILKPGGVFCYCDIFQPFRVPIWRQLLKKTGFIIDWEDDVTANVASAIARGADEQRAFYDEMIADGTGASELLDPVYTTINRRMLRKYSANTWKYVAWQLRKPSELVND